MDNWGIIISEIVFGWKCEPHQQNMIYELFKKTEKCTKISFYKMINDKDNIFDLKKAKYIPMGYQPIENQL